MSGKRIRRKKKRDTSKYSKKPLRYSPETWKILNDSSWKTEIESIPNDDKHFEERERIFLKREVDLLFVEAELRFGKDWNKPKFEYDIEQLRFEEPEFPEPQNEEDTIVKIKVTPFYSINRDPAKSKILNVINQFLKE